MSNIIGIIFALLGFGVLVMVHELGHLIAAKKSGVKVEEFWIGMGPALFSKQIGETEYSLRLLPMGGACVMEGEDNDAISSRSFGKATKLKRFIILIAGVVMNFITGFVILLFVAPSIYEDGQVVTQTIESFDENFKYEGEEGLMVGDKIIEIDGKKIYRRSDISKAIIKGMKDNKFDITVKRDGKKVQLKDFEMKPIENKNGGKSYGIVFKIEKATIPMRISLAFWDSVDMARAIWDSLGMLAKGEVGVEELSGPVGVTAVMTQTVKMGFDVFLKMLAFISINLGVMNLLPIPGLDGGRILFLTIESITRRPLNPKVEGYINMAGIIFLLALMIYATGNDILRLLNLS